MVCSVQNKWKVCKHNNNGVSALKSTLKGGVYLMF